jgi:hypothetical protein
MAHLVGTESNKALNEVGKIDGGYYITKNLWNKFLTTANMTEGQVKQFGSFMPGGFVASNTYYNMLLLYILVFVADGNVDKTVYDISRYYTAIVLSYIKKKYFPIMDKSLMEYTLMNAHAATVAKQGWAVFVIKVADETLEKYLKNFTEKVSLYDYYRYIVDVYNKVNQSVKHLARRYYKNVGKADTDDIRQDLDKALNNINEVTMNPKFIEYIAQLSGASEIDVEDICVKIHDYNDVDSTMQNIILRFLRQYRDREGINKVGITVAAGRGLVMQPIPTLAAKTLLDVGIEPDREKIRAVLFIALLCIMVN